MSEAWMPELGNFTFSFWNAVLLAILLTVGLVCVGCIGHALLNLKTEKSVYDALQKEDKLRILYERYMRGEVRNPDAQPVSDFYSAVVEQARQYEIQGMNSSAAVQRYLKALYGDAISNKLCSGYVSDRLYAVLCSVDTDNMVKKLPELEDLRELTLQRERGGFSTSVFRLLLPSILVCGILGTLVGVHSCLGEGKAPKEMIPLLADALLPGALAVGITVVVMCIRGFYNSRWAHFVSDFDEYTLRHLLPLFRPSTSQVETDVGKLVEALSKTREQYAPIQDLRVKIHNFQNKVDECHSLCAELLGASRSRLESDCVSYELRYGQGMQLQDVQTQLVASLNMLQSEYKNLLNRVQQVQKHVLSTQQRNSLLRVFENLIPPARESIKRLQSINLGEELNGLQMLVADAGKSLAAIEVGEVQEEESRIQKAVAEFAQLEKLCRQFEEAGKTITKIDDEIDEEIVRRLNPTVTKELPDLIGTLEQKYEDAFTASEQIRSKLVIFNEEQRKKITDTRRSLQPKMYSLLHSKGEKKSYPSGWLGFKLRVRDWRLAERNMWVHSRKIGWRTWCFIAAATGLFIVWPAWWICLLCGVI